MTKKNYKMKNAETMVDAEVEIISVKMNKLTSVPEKKDKVNDDGYEVRATYAIYSDEANQIDRKPIPYYEIRNFIWDGKKDFDTLALSEF